MNINKLLKLLPDIIKKLFPDNIKICENIKLPEEIQIASGNKTYIASNNKTNNLHIENFNYFEIKSELEKMIEKKVEEGIEKRRKEIELLSDDKQIQFLVNSSSDILHQSIANNQSIGKGNISINTPSTFIDVGGGTNEEIGSWSIIEKDKDT